MIYLDNAATTKMFESSADVYKEYACRNFFNPSAGYKKALEVSHQLENVRSKIKSVLGARSGDVIFTGGATESNNLAIMGSKRNGKWEYVFSIGEHPSVYNCARELREQGHVVHFISLDKNGEINYDELESKLNERTRLISVMHVSNETGAVNDLEKISKLRKKLSPSALLHVDGVQAFCKINCNVDNLSIDFYTISAHKFHGPKGVGVLYVRNIEKLKNIVYGGGQEKGYRSGTENVAGIMAMQDAIDNINIDKNLAHVNYLNENFKSALKAFDNKNQISFIETKSPYILSIGFSGVNGETLMRSLEDKGVLVGIGSACSTKKSGNRILESIGLKKEEIKTHIRVSFDFSQTVKEVAEAAKIIYQTYQEIWEKVK